MMNGRVHCDDLPGQDGRGERIEADAISVEIVDRHTGKLYRRTLPVRYCETANGIVLEGEALNGAVAQIVCLSEAALAKIGELFGRGPDAPRCKEPETD